MAEVHILGGDFGERKKAKLGRGPTLVIPMGRLKRSVKLDLKKELDRVEVQTEDSIKKLTWSRVLLFGVFALGMRKDKSKIYFAAYLKDGRKFLAMTDRKTFTQIQAAAFSAS